MLRGNPGHVTERNAGGGEDHRLVNENINFILILLSAKDATEVCVTESIIYNNLGRGEKVK